jgi:hypothetical protein
MMSSDIGDLNVEVDHIPEDEGPQHILRVMYFVHRAHSPERSLSKAKATLMGCIDAVKECYQDFEPKYDRSFFDER